jgi:SAM-dependent methyltransferase
MHASSLENLWQCYRRYIAGGPLEKQEDTIVLDVGGADVNGSYREVFGNPPFRYWAADMASGSGVDIVLSDPYRIPLNDGSVDIVISGQMLEHSEFFWRIFEEMVRVVRSDGFIFLIVPSAGPIHRYPVDCYRFYPDAYRALAKHAGCILVESWLDERGPWRDLVGVFRRADAPALAVVTRRPVPALPSWGGAPGTAEEETIAGDVSHLEILDRLHRQLEPTHYLEIGIRHGASLALARGPATGVDPAPTLDRDLPMTTRVIALTSDEFFARQTDGITADLCFIDGMHLFEYALRDFMNFERCAAPGAVAVIDDIFPNHPVQAERDRRTRAWTGDIWRLVEVLQRYRPDLFLLRLDAAPAGLLLVAGLDAANRVLWDAYNPIVREARELAGPPQSVIERQGAVAPGGDVVRRVINALKAARAEGCQPHEIAELLRLARQGDSPHRALLRRYTPELSFIVMGYNMARELPRTIRSLSPAMQRDIDPGDYEVILVDNGSTQTIDEVELRRLLPGLVVHRLQDATVSPVKAIDFGLTVARGDLVGVCIDGAGIASPGLLSKALAASRLHGRPMIGTIGFHLGPEVQTESVKRGYNQAVEDELLAGSGWEADGYRLFTISTLAPSSGGGWFELPAESNAFFLRAGHWRALGGWGEGFMKPRGGLVNLDTWARVCADPTGEVIMLLGEATFHQIHCGIATNNLNPPFAPSHEEYMRLRGRAFERPTRQPLYFGTLPETMRTTLRFSLERLTPAEEVLSASLVSGDGILAGSVQRPLAPNLSELQPKIHDLAEEPSPNKRAAILVLGVGRSGTSLLARVLNLLGARLPEQVLGPGHGNPLGHWEPVRLLEINEEILSTLGRSWHDPRPIPSNWFRSKAAYTFQERISAEIASCYGNARLILIKEPRICRLAPLYLDALDVLGIEPLVILLIRHPAEAIQSIQERDGGDLETHEIRWLRHLVESEEASRACARVWISFEQLCANWEATAQSIADGLAVVWPNALEKVAGEVQDILRRRHRHHRITDDPASLHLSPLTIRAWQAAQRGLERDETAARALLDEIRTTITELDRLNLPQQECSEKQLAETGESIRRLQAAENIHRDEIARLSAEAAETVQQLQAVESAYRDQVAQLSAGLQERASDYERLDREVQERAIQVSRLQEHLTKLQAEQSERINDGERLRRQIDSIHRSICWRITWPIRWIHKQVACARGIFSKAPFL